MKFIFQMGSDEFISHFLVHFPGDCDILTIAVRIEDCFTMPNPPIDELASIIQFIVLRFEGDGSGNDADLGPA
jgi:hypothetical protein